jgi:choline-sulfatase
MTGKHISSIKVWDNAAPLASDEPTICHYLTNVGYETVASGKLHYVGPDQLHGFQRRLTTDIYPASFDWLPTAKRKEPERYIDRRSHAQGYKTPRVGVRKWTRFLAYDAEAQFRALEYLRERGTGEREDESPFFLCVSFHCPHDPFQVTQDLWDLYEGEPIEIPEYPDNMDETYSVMDRWLNAYHGTDRYDIKDPESLTALRRAYYGLVSSVDRKVGQLVATLEEMGLREDTVVIFTSDHGDMLAEKNMVQKRSFYEFSARVPMIISFPDRWNAGTVCEQPVSMMDLAPTVLDIAEVSDRMPMDAESLLSCIGGTMPDTREVYSESHTNGVYAPCFMIRKGRYKYVYIHGEDAQLFDLVEDPGEWNDLAGDPAFQDIEEELRGRVLQRFAPDVIEEELQRSLDNRGIIKEALHLNDTHWDYAPQWDVTEQYVR